ncbi:MAG: phage tail sheath subtilisin-like domain-containing protein [Chloroflexaceae bacterium]|nr:phage tail sheath subtilisin-like domain-containing protein [Chloroflexaceae bacterium]
MPEYLAPGVYVEETSFRARSIEGVSTTTTGFVGPARYGPTDLPLEVITSIGEFEYIYGDGRQLQYVDAATGAVEVQHNYLWHAARAFFAEGGKRLYVARIFRKHDDTLADDADVDTSGGLLYNDGCARASFPAGAPASDQITVRARFPGTMGNLRLRFVVRVGQNILSNETVSESPAVIETRLGALLPRDVVLVHDLDPSQSPPAVVDAIYVAERDPTHTPPWRFVQDAPAIISPPAFPPAASSLRAGERDAVRVVSLTLIATAADGSEQVIGADLPLDPGHLRGDTRDSLFDRFGRDPGSAAQARALPVVISRGANIVTGIDVLRALVLQRPALLQALLNPEASDLERTVEIELRGGNDGRRPGSTEYEGTAPLDAMTKTGLKALEDVEDISIVAAPGSSHGYEGSYRREARAIMGLLIAHAELMRYRIAVLDSGDGQSIAQVRALRATMDSKYAALYYPWVRVLDPITRQEIVLPPSGFVAGIYARNDITRAVYKAPANEVVNLALGFEQNLNKAQQDVLNPEGINCFRFFEGRGYRLWGARTISSDPEWKYVNLRRYFAYLERSIDKGTQWAVFEPNGELLWANVRRTIEDFLLNEWQSGALLGEKPERAFFVRCDRSTMTQNDLDNGRLVCLIGVAALRPAEFVIFRIGQWTGDRR